MFKKIIVSLLLGLVFSAKVLAQNVDYYLPYPGILPDHPLYWLKMVRDRIGLIITTNPQVKAEKLLLYADKRLGAAWALIDGNKLNLGVSTLSKAEKYLEQAVALTTGEEAKNRLGKAVLKHEEVVRRLRSKTEPDYTPVLDEILVKLNELKPAPPAGPEVTRVDIEISTTTTALAALEKAAEENNWEISVKDFSFGKLVEAVAGVANNESMAWIFYVNGEAGDKASDRFEVKAGDRVEWKYEAVKP